MPTLEELADVVKKSMTAGQNIPQLTIGRLVVWSDWKSFLSKHFRSIPGITEYHHFRFSHSSPGTVFVRDLYDSDEHEVKISPQVIAFDNSPVEFQPKGMDLTRQWYPTMK